MHNHSEESQPIRVVDPAKSFALVRGRTRISFLASYQGKNFSLVITGPG